VGCNRNSKYFSADTATCHKSLAYIQKWTWCAHLTARPEAEHSSATLLSTHFPLFLTHLFASNIYAFDIKRSGKVLFRKVTFIKHTAMQLHAALPPPALERPSVSARCQRNSPSHRLAEVWLQTCYLPIFTYTPCVLISVKVFSPTDAQLDSLKNNFKFALKLALKGCYMFRCEKHHPRGAHCLSLAEVTVVKMS
jgi:hypothetical protein